MNRSLRRRLLLGIGLATTIVFAVGMGAVYQQTRNRSLREFDETLASKARALAVLTEQTAKGIEIDFAEQPLHEFARKIRPEYYQVRDESGQTLARSRRLDSSDLPIGIGSLNAPEARALTLPDGRSGRMVSVLFRPHKDGDTLPFAKPGEVLEDSDDDDAVVADSPRVSLVVAAGTDVLEAGLADEARSLLLVAVASVLVLLVAIGAFVSRSLRPVNDLAQQIAAIDEKSLDESVSPHGIPTEILPVVTKLNELMSRLRDAFQRERTLSSNVAHELRTPIAGLRSTLEVTLRRNRDVHEYRESIADCVTICDGTQRMVETLLSLSRIEAGQSTLDEELGDPSLLLTTSWKTFGRLAVERDLDVSWALTDDVLLRTDANKLRLVLVNLLDNAVCYTTRGGEIRITSTDTSSGYSISIANSGCELSPADQEKVFHRFWRADSARAATGTHAGLGMSLCRHICELLEISLTVSIEQGVFAVTLGFPPDQVEVADTTAAPVAMAGAGED